jgi:predicted AAA+ superfamily ATPase
MDIPDFHNTMLFMVKRPLYIERLSTAVMRSPVIALLGPRQSGKTTLARMFGEARSTTYFDLESQPDRRRLQNPEFMLGALKGLVVLDEIQAMPELFGVLRVLADRSENKARFLILGSASPGIIKGASETLAGRVEFVELAGFDLLEASAEEQEKLWLRGGFPRSFLSSTDEDSMAWREGFIRTFLERDIPQLGITIPSPAMRRFWTMLSHYHGQYWNGSELARSMGLSDKTVRSYLDILTGAYMIRQLQPWHENIGKRQVKAPKIFLRDSGLLHALLGLPDLSSLQGHPKVGASWEGFAIEQALHAINPAESYFWGTHGGAEIDLFFIQRGKRYGIEAKYSEAPHITRSMENSLEVLGLEHLWILYPGKKDYPVNKKISVCPLGKMAGINRRIQGGAI